MKNRFSRAISLVLCIALILSTAVALSSCTLFEKVPTADDILALEKEERGFELFDVASRSLRRADSYTANGKLDFHVSFEGDSSVTVNDVICEKVDSARDDGYKSIFEANNSFNVKVGEESFTSTTAITEGYSDGIFFRKTVTEETAQALYSRLGKIEYRDHEEYIGNLLELDFSKDACFTSVCNYNEDGSFVAVYSNFFPEQLAVFARIFENYDHLVSEEIKLDDVKATLSVDKDFYIRKIVLNYEFKNVGESADHIPTATYTREYSDYDSTEFSSPDLSDYTEVDDLRMIDIVDNAFDTTVKRTEAEFEMSLTEKVIGGASGNTLNDTLKGSFKNSDTGFSYNFTVESGDNVRNVRYSNGKLSIDGNYTDSTDEIEKTNISLLLGREIFEKNSVTNVEKNSDGSYLFTFSNSILSSYDVILEEIGAQEWLDRKVTIKIHLDGKRIEGFAFKVELKAQVDGETVTYRKTTELVIE